MHRKENFMQQIYEKSYAYCTDYVKTNVRKIYKEAFPKCERFPFWILRQCSKEINVHLDALLSEGIPVGMQFIVKYDNIAYLMYFAINSNCRNLGFGSKVLKNLIIRNDNVLLCIEKPTDDLKKRRKNFYLRNGFFETGYCIEDTGVEYEFLTSTKGYSVNEDILKKRYKKMSSNPLIQYIIRHTFTEAQ